MWLQRTIVERVGRHCNSSSELRPFGLLYLLTYAYLWRLPSEALPMKLGRAGLHVDGETMVLTLAGRQVSRTSCVIVFDNFVSIRKNKPHCSRLATVSDLSLC